MLLLSRNAFIALFIILFSCFSAFAEGEKIADIQVTGNRRIETAAILNVIKTKAGDILYAEKADADVKAVYKLGHFQDVKADGATSEKGYVLTFTVVEKPIVREIAVVGNKELGIDKIREAMDLKPNSVFSSKDLAKSIKKVKKLYADEGFYLAEVEGGAEKRSETDVKVSFKIAEGKKILIKTIQFEGNKAFSARKLRGVMETKEKWFLSWLTGAGTYKEEALKNDSSLIADLYYNNGYVNVKVGDPQVKLLDDKSGLLVTVGITEGEQFRNGALDFKGDLLETREELGKKLKLKSGEVFSRAILRGDVFALTDVYADKGYAFANVNPLTKVNQEKKTIDILFDMEKGEKVYIDRINIAGNTRTRDKVIRREIRLTEGELYGSTPLKRSKQNINNLGYFEEVNITTAKGSSDNKLNMNVDVKEKPTGTFSVGGGYSSVDGLIGQGSVQQANFLGMGLKANAAVSFGGKSKTYNLGLTDPYFMDSKWTLGGDVYRTERDYIDFSRRVTGGDVKAGYPLSDFINTFWMYKYEKKNIYDVSPLLTVVPEASSTTSSIYASLTRNTTDYRPDPSSGMVNTISTEFAGLGGTNRFMRYIGESAWFRPFKWSTVFSLRGTLGYVQSLGRDVPIDEKFYLGGINTIRGFKARTVSPVQNGAYVGGNKEAVFNAEYVFPLLKDAGLKGLVFYDMGDSYAESKELFSTFKSSYGFGIRWFSPMGPLRLEYGIPMNPRTGIDSSSGKLEFSIGNFF